MTPPRDPEKVREALVRVLETARTMELERLEEALGFDWTSPIDTQRIASALLGAREDARLAWMLDRKASAQEHKELLQSRVDDEVAGRGGAKNRRNLAFQEFDYFQRYGEWPFGEPVAVAYESTTQAAARRSGDATGGVEP